MTGIWTTERAFYSHRSVIHRDNSNGFVKGYNQNNGYRKFCDCSKAYQSNYQQQGGGQRAFQQSGYNYYKDEMNHPYRRSDHPGVDDKLEEPFKIDRGR